MPKTDPLPFKISLITVCYNAEQTIETCIRSVIKQDFGNLEYIIIDGNSTDNTVNIIKQHQQYITHFISEQDKGIYDAMNKGIALATGDVVGVLNADDYFADDTVLSLIADSFKKSDAEILYGDLDYVNDTGKVIRKWRSGDFKRRNLDFGWMPPHPTFYCKRHLFDDLGMYNLDYGTAADYELMIRFLYTNRLPAFYLKKVIVKMKTGGTSNQSLKNRLKATINDFRAMRTNRIIFPLVTIILKPARKIIQFF